MQLRLPALLVAVAAIAAASGCDDATGIKAQYPNREDTLVVYALNGTPVTVPTALQIRTLSAVRIDASYNFDVAFDIDAAGQVIAYTPRAVGGELVAVRRVGLKFPEQLYGAITAAPTGGYKYDSLVVLPVGKALIVDSFDPGCSPYSILGPNIRAKLVLDSVNVTSRSIYLHALSNPNCGFRQLTPGTPKE
jgi:hypothetical protein